MRSLDVDDVDLFPRPAGVPQSATTSGEGEGESQPPDLVPMEGSCIRRVFERFGKQTTATALVATPPSCGVRV